MAMIYLKLLLIILYCMFIVGWNVRYFLNKRKAGLILLTGSSRYKAVRIMLLAVLVNPLILWANGNWKYVFFVLTFALLVDGKRSFMGEHGLAVNGEFIAKERILHYFMTEGSVDQYGFMLREQTDKLKIRMIKKFASQPLEEIMQTWFNKDLALNDTRKK
jgi:hypothetical protein